MQMLCKWVSICPYAHLYLWHYFQSLKCTNPKINHCNPYRFCHDVFLFCVCVCLLAFLYVHVHLNAYFSFNRPPNLLTLISPIPLLPSAFPLEKYDIQVWISSQGFGRIPQWELPAFDFHNSCFARKNPFRFWIERENRSSLLFRRWIPHFSSFRAINGKFNLQTLRFSFEVKFWEDHAILSLDIPYQSGWTE